nr:PREDICTED: myosin-13-like [Bemisia tabaci]
MRRTQMMRNKEGRQYLARLEEEIKKGFDQRIRTIGNAYRVLQEEPIRGMDRELEEKVEWARKRLENRLKIQECAAEVPKKENKERSELRAAANIAAKLAAPQGRAKEKGTFSAINNDYRQRSVSRTVPQTIIVERIVKEKAAPQTRREQIEEVLDKRARERANTETTIEILAMMTKRDKKKLRKLAEQGYEIQLKTHVEIKVIIGKDREVLRTNLINMIPLFAAVYGRDFVRHREDGITPNELLEYLKETEAETVIWFVMNEWILSGTRMVPEAVRRQVDELRATRYVKGKMEAGIETTTESEGEKSTRGRTRVKRGEEGFTSDSDYHRDTGSEVEVATLDSEALTSSEEEEEEVDYEEEVSEIPPPYQEREEEGRIYPRVDISESEEEEVEMTKEGVEVDVKPPIAPILPTRKERYVSSEEKEEKEDTEESKAKIKEMVRGKLDLTYELRDAQMENRNLKIVLQGILDRLEKIEKDREEPRVERRMEKQEVAGASKIDIPETPELKPEPKPRTRLAGKAAGEAEFEINGDKLKNSERPRFRIAAKVAGGAEFELNADKLKELHDKVTAPFRSIKQSCDKIEGIMRLRGGDDEDKDDVEGNKTKGQGISQQKKRSRETSPELDGEAEFRSQARSEKEKPPPTKKVHTPRKLEGKQGFTHIQAAGNVALSPKVKKLEDLVDLTSNEVDRSENERESNRRERDNDSDESEQEEEETKDQVKMETEDNEEERENKEVGSERSGKNSPDPKRKPYFRSVSSNSSRSEYIHPALSEEDRKEAWTGLTVGAYGQAIRNDLVEMRKKVENSIKKYSNESKQDFRKCVNWYERKIEDVMTLRINMKSLERTVTEAVIESTERVLTPECAVLQKVIEASVAETISRAMTERLDAFLECTTEMLERSVTEVNKSIRGQMEESLKELNKGMESIRNKPEKGMEELKEQMVKSMKEEMRTISKEIQERVNKAIDKLPEAKTEKLQRSLEKKIEDGLKGMAEKLPEAKIKELQKNMEKQIEDGFKGLVGKLPETKTTELQKNMEKKIDEGFKGLLQKLPEAKTVELQKSMEKKIEEGFKGLAGKIPEAKTTELQKSMEKKIEEGFKGLNSKMEKMKSEAKKEDKGWKVIETRNQPKERDSYASRLKEIRGKRDPSVTKIMVRSKSKKEEGEEEEREVEASEVKKMIKDVKPEGTIQEFSRIKGGVIVQIKTDNKEITRKDLEKKLEGKMEVKELQEITPTLKILGVPKDMADEKVVELLHEDNLADLMTLEEAKKDVKILNRFKGGAKFTRTDVAIIKASQKIAEELLKREIVYLDFVRCRVEEEISVRLCGNCGMPGHKAADCKREQVCFRCGEKEHVKRECKKAMKCVNCVREKRKKTDHDVYSRECPTYKREMEFQLRKRKWGWSEGENWRGDRKEEEEKKENENGGDDRKEVS